MSQLSGLYCSPRLLECIHRRFCGWHESEECRRQAQQCAAVAIYIPQTPRAPNSPKHGPIYVPGAAKEVLCNFFEP